MSERTFAPTAEAHAAQRCQECGRRLVAGGPYGDDLFCSQRCGHAWAVRTVRALLDASDEPRWGKSINEWQRDGGE